MKKLLCVLLVMITLFTFALAEETLITFKT